MYPLAQDYAKAMQNLLLNQIQWGNAYFGEAGMKPALRLTWPLDKEQFKPFAELLKPVMAAPLTSPAGGFGIPPEIVPTIVSYTPATFGEQGAFAPTPWQMKINLSAMKTLFQIDQVAKHGTSERYSQTTALQQFSDTIYHESRHCQQNFWIYSLILQHPGNFSEIPNILYWPDLASGFKNPQSTTRAQAAVSLASKQSLPDDTAALISLKRMTVGLYFATLNNWRKQKYYPPYVPDKAAFDAEYQRARIVAMNLLQHVGLGGTPIDVDAMVEEPSRCRRDYSGRPWENDAFFCGDMATAYWNASMGLLLKTYPADQCSRAYEFDYAYSKRSESASGGTGGEQ
jgi:hypothetical protein